MRAGLGSKEREREREREREAIARSQSASERKRVRYGTHSKRGNEGQQMWLLDRAVRKIRFPFPSFPCFRFTCSPSFRFYFLVVFILFLSLAMFCSLSLSQWNTSLYYLWSFFSRRSKRRLRMRLLKGEVSRSTCVKVLYITWHSREASFVLVSILRCREVRRRESIMLPSFCLTSYDFCQASLSSLHLYCFYHLRALCK